MAKCFENNDILLFQFDKLKQNCRLKHFLHFLNSQGIKRPLRFAYVEANAPLISNLSLRENIYLESIPNLLSETKDFQMLSFLQNSSNQHLIDFYNRIPLLNELPENVDTQTRKMAALFKALLQHSDYLLLESPERYLDDMTLKLFTNALRFQVASRAQTVLINSENPQFWFSYASKVVQIQSVGTYQVSPNSEYKAESSMINVLPKQNKVPSGELHFLNIDDFSKNLKNKNAFKKAA